MVGTTIWAALTEGKIVCLLSSIAFCVPLIVFFIVLLCKGHLLHKCQVGGWIPEGHCCWLDIKNPFSFFLRILLNKMKRLQSWV